MTAPDPAALLAAMESAARCHIVAGLRSYPIRPKDLADLCAALRASQEREAAAVAALRHIAKAWPGTPAAVHSCAALIREDAAP